MSLHKQKQKHKHTHTHRVDPSQQHLCRVGVDLLYAHLLGYEQVCEQPPLHLLPPLKLGLDLCEPLIDMNAACNQTETEGGNKWKQGLRKGEEGRGCEEG